MPTAFPVAINLHLTEGMAAELASLAKAEQLPIVAVIRRAIAAETRRAAAAAAPVYVDEHLAKQNKALLDGILKGPLTPPPYPTPLPHPLTPPPYSTPKPVPTAADVLKAWEQT